MPTYEVIAPPDHMDVPYGVGRGQTFISDRIIDSPCVKKISDEPYWNFDLVASFSSGFNETVTIDVPSETIRVDFTNVSTVATVSVFNGDAAIGVKIPPGRQFTLGKDMYRKVPALRLVATSPINTNEFIVSCFKR